MSLFALAVVLFLLFLCETSLADQVSLPDDHPPTGVMGEHALKTVEIGLPLYQDLDGPQLKSDYSFKIA